MLKLVARLISSPLVWLLLTLAVLQFPLGDPHFRQSMFQKSYQENSNFLSSAPFRGSVGSEDVAVTYRDWTLRTATLLPSSTYHFMVWKPLQELYFRGPQWNGFGFWAGQRESAICARITSLPELHFERSETNLAECRETLFRHLDSFVILIHLLISLVLLYLIVQMIQSTAQTRAMVRAISELQKPTMVESSSSRRRRIK